MANIDENITYHKKKNGNITGKLLDLLDKLVYPKTI